MFCLNLQEEAEYISKKLGCTLEASTAFVELEDAYYDIIGLNVYDDTSPIELSPEEATVVDTDVLIKFICSNCDFIPEELCERMLEAEYEYFVLIGLVDDSDF